MAFLRTLVILLLSVPLVAAQNPAASLEGVVVSAVDRGLLVSGATVEVRRQDGVPPQAYAATAASNGSFSIRGIRPGQYVLVANRAGFLEAQYGQRRAQQAGVVLALAAGQRLTGLEILMTPAGAIHGRIYDRDGDPVGSASVLALSPGYQDGVRALKIAQWTRTNDLGQYRLFGLPPGQYYVSATPVPGTWPAIAIDTRLAGISNAAAGPALLPFYYPGTEDVRRASAIELRAGANYGGVDFVVIPSPTRHVRGLIRGGRTASLVLAPLNPVAGIVTRKTTVDPDTGAFDFADIAPGVYVLVAKTEDASSRQIIDVGDAGLNNVGLAFDGGIRIPGRVVFDDRPPADHDPDLDHVYFDVAMEPRIAGVPVDTYSPLLNGSFALRDLIRGDYRITNFTIRNPTPALRNAYLKSVRLGDRDVLNGGLQVSGPVDGTLEIVVGMRPSSLEGTVVDDTGRPIGNATVVLANDSTRRASLDLYRSAVTDTSGRFRLDRLPPGNFKLFAWESVEETAWQDPEFMRVFEDRGRQIRIRENARETAQVTAIR